MKILIRNKKPQDQLLKKNGIHRLVSPSLLVGKLLHREPRNQSQDVMEKQPIIRIVKMKYEILNPHNRNLFLKTFKFRVGVVIGAV